VVDAKSIPWEKEHWERHRDRYAAKLGN